MLPLKKIIFIAVFLSYIFIIARPLIPGLTPGMFEFHDETQAVRIMEFSENLKNFQIPPRIAPHFSFNLGFPVFNFYSPLAYWVGSFFYLLGLSAIGSLKITFFLALLVGFVGMYLFLKEFFRFLASLLGAVLYVTSPWVAVEIFVRGNMAEVWFLALLPFALYFLKINSYSKSRFVFALSVFIQFFTITSHNIFLLLYAPVAVLFILTLRNKRKNLASLFLSYLMSSYFMLPLIFENSLTYAQTIARQTYYGDHFLCLNQIWTTPMWGFGGSLKGCTDAFSFMIGKLPIVLGGFGLLLFLIRIVRVKKYFYNNLTHIVLMVFGIVSIFLTLYESTFLWKLFEPVLSLFQFPWRFLVFGLFATCFFAAYAASFYYKKIVKIVTLILIVVAMFTSIKFFYRNEVSKSDYIKLYVSDAYLANRAAYDIPEYLPKSANLQSWLALKKDAQKQNYPIIYDRFESLDGKRVSYINESLFKSTIETNSKNVRINIHYFPFWIISVNEKKLSALSTDSLGRPTIKLDGGLNKVQVLYDQTVIEKIANWLTCLSVVAVIIITFNKRIWHKIKFITT